MSDNSTNPGINISTALVVVLSIGVLYVGRDIFVPFALAILLSFMLAPPVAWLRRVRMPRTAAVVFVVSGAVALVAGVSVLVGSQVVALSENLPTYQKTMQKKIRSIRSAAPGGSAIDRTSAVIQALGKELSEVAGTTPRTRDSASNAPKTQPMPVRIESGEQHPLETLQSIAGSLMGPVSTAGLVIVFIFFVLLAPSDLRDRFIRLAGTDLHRTTEALSEAASRVSRYLLMQLVVNATYGIPLGIGLYLIGVPGAFLWALLATLLRFIPYLGPVIAGIFPMMLAFAVDPGWNMLLWTGALILVLELVSNNVIEPWLYGSSTGMTPMAVILSAIFWTLLWGPVGLILATPLTVCFVVMGRYVPQLAFIDVLLGSDPVLSADERIYQRLLAGNVEEAIDIAEEEVAGDSLLTFYDKVALPALRLAENARERGASKDDRKNVADGIRAVVADLHDFELRRLEEEGKHPIQWLGTPVLCVAGRGELDFAAATLLGHVLEGRGIGARVIPSAAISLDNIGGLDLAGVEVVCLSYLNPTPKAYARFVCRRLRPRSRRLKIVVGAWNLAPEAGTSEKLATDVGADSATTSIEAAAHIIEDIVGQAVAPADLPPVPVPAEEEARLHALQSSGALDPDNSAHLDRVAHTVADAMDMPIGMVSLIDESLQLWKGAWGLPQELEKSRQGTRETSVCNYVVAANAPLVVEDTARDPRFSQNPLLRENGMRFYAGVPLRTKSGHVIGSLCVIDLRPRTLSPRELKLMQVIADELMVELAKGHKLSRETDAVGADAGALPLPLGSRG
ncbi:AI-2E family transporter [Noviherbaspirillum aerium]|uniref:AI-2E family transporter n=1 Tax=Noviherbaspirillum aerium TaxID=2588497 RepID=UPI001CEF76F2|nr:AI-2E family transporter [Noviherbaspirillum aerium]